MGEALNPGHTVESLLKKVKKYECLDPETRA